MAIHHSCPNVENDIDHPFLGELDEKPTVVGTDYEGQYRCTECKRKVRLNDGTTHGEIGDGGLLVEPPFPDGYCRTGEVMH
jgi:hypothetical protein